MPVRATPALLTVGAPNDRLPWLPHVIVVYALAFLVWIAAPVAEQDKATWSTALIVPVRFVAAGLAIWAARVLPRGAARRAWRLLAVALAAYALGTAIAAVAGLSGMSLPFPSFVDVLLLAFYPLALFGLLAFPRASVGRADLVRVGLDAAIWVGGGALVLWAVTREAWAAGLPDDTLARLTATAYPLGDLLVLSGIAAVTLRAASGANRRPILLLALGLGLLFADDVLWTWLTSNGAYAPGHPIDGLWILSSAVIALAADAQRRVATETGATRELPELLPTWTNLVPYGFLAAGITAGFVQIDLLSGSDGPQFAFGIALLGGLVLVRQVVALNEQTRLVDDRATRRSESRFRSLIQNASDVICIVEPDGSIREATAAARAVLGVEAEELVGRSILDLMPEASRAAARLELELLAGQGGNATFDWELRHRDGRLVAIECVGADLRDDEHVAGLVLTLQDVSERRAFERELSEHALHDSLTLLANRTLLLERIGHALTKQPRRRSGLTLIFLDLDDFKKVNDSLGHRAGDGLLVDVAARLTETVRASDTVARLGGDEFAIFLEHVESDAEVTACADRILAGLDRPFEVDGHAVTVGASIGIATAVDGTTADQLLRNADIAMYRSKVAGKRCQTWYRPEMEQAAQDRLELEEDLRAAVERADLFVEYQPVFDLRTGRIAAFEALARWRHPTRGLVSPVTFIPIAEATGLIVPIGRWILDEACRNLSRWERATGRDDVTVSVNLSAHQLASATLIDDVIDVLQRHDLAPHRLTLEVTESLLIEEHAIPAGLLAKLHDLGVRLAIDDFGTGYSSLAYLHRFPTDILKIDKAFVDGLGADQERHDLAAAVIQLGHALHMTLVAEGVEDPAQVTQLQALGCDLAQGFHLGRPMSADAAGHLLTSMPNKRPGRGQPGRVTRSAVAQVAEAG